MSSPGFKNYSAIKGREQAVIYKQEGLENG